MSKILLCLMAKTPRPGMVKTRMRPQLDALQCSRLARRMLLHTVRNACAHWPGEVALFLYPQAPPRARRLADQFAITVQSQRGDDLGARIAHALQYGIARGGAAAVMGCDVPHCDKKILADAHALLARGENPLGPAADGGFYLLGLQFAPAAMFRGVRWGGAQAMAQLLRRADIRFTRLPVLRDIDCYADLCALAAMDPRYQNFARAR